MKILVCLLALLFTTTSLSARVREVGNGREFPTLQVAATVAQPGDTILIREGVYGSAGHIVDLKGSEVSPIVIRAADNETVIFRGGSNAIQLSDPAYLSLEGFIFEGQTGNGVNIDDGGTYDTPAQNIWILNCEWRAMDASGNNDQLKLSGVDYFAVENCRFADGAEGGSAVDMVGCHFGTFRNNSFQNAGSNCIQAKGGTGYIDIVANHFKDGGQRAINIGGSTGLEFFRPFGATYEAINIYVWSNIFEGSVAPIAFVGSLNSQVFNNTIIRPERWAVRILQESVDGFAPTGHNSFFNNIIVFTSQQPAFNIGDGTAPETFTISHNLWYNPDNASWSGPNTPVDEPGRIVNQDPRFADPAYRLSPNSPAVHSGFIHSQTRTDLFGMPFSNPPSMGAIEYQEASVALTGTDVPLPAYPNPTTGKVVINSSEHTHSDVTVIDLMGRIVLRGSFDSQLSIDLSSLPPGRYTLQCDGKRASIVKQ